MTKKILAVIFISLFLGAFIFFFLSTFSTTSSTMANPIKRVSNFLKSNPTPIPTPSPITIDQSSNLNAEIQNLTPKDHNSQIENLKQEVNSF